MKLKKQILSLLLVLLIMLSSIPLTVSANGNTLLINNDILNNMDYSIEYGWDGEEYRFDKNTLYDIDKNTSFSLDNVDVYLVASTKIIEQELEDRPNAGEVKVKFYDFKLAGADAQEYSLIQIPDHLNFTETVNITKKVIKISAQHPYRYYGQAYIQNLTDVADYSNQLLSGDDLTINAEFKIKTHEDGKTGKEIGSYEFSLEELNLTGEDSMNYDVVLDESINYEIKPYEVNVEPTVEIERDEDNAGSSKIKLFAPEDFKISKENRISWHDSITISTRGENEGEINYYLKNVNENDEDCFGAITEKCTYKYSLEVLAVECIELDKDNVNDSLNFLYGTIFSNGDLTATVNLKEIETNQEIKVYFGEEGNYQVNTIIPNNIKEEYTTEFAVSGIENGTVKKNLNAYAENEFVKSLKNDFISVKSDIDGVTHEVEGASLIIDKVNPIIDISDDFKFKKIESNSDGSTKKVSGIQAEFEISDQGSGIAKVEYGWDLDETNCDEQRNANSDKKIGFKGNEYTSEYVVLKNYGSITKTANLTFELMWDEAVYVKEDTHILYIRVTDNAGNVYETQIMDDVKRDFDAPIIKSIEIREATENNSEKINFSGFGSFFNNAVEIAVIVTDEVNERGSGIQAVIIDGVKSIFPNDQGEYIITISPSAKKTLTVVAIDDYGNRTTALATKIPECGFIKSDELIIENNAPLITFDNITSYGYKDNNNKIWFGQSNQNKEFEIAVSDVGDVVSGLKSFSIKHNGEIVYSKSDYNSIDYTSDKMLFKISELEEGERVFTVEVEDNCGNFANEEVVFYKDTIAPQNGKIYVSSNNGVVIDEKQWFDKNDNIIFRIEAIDNQSGIKNISLNINGNNIKYGFDCENSIKSDEIGCYVEVDISGIETNKKHQYIINDIIISDFGENKIELNPVIVYKDFENPTIEKFTVEKKTDAIDKILNILSFGIYSNDSLIFKVYTNDVEFDSGIDYATINYDGLEEAKTMFQEEDGIFSFEISKGAEVFKSNINVTVYDKYGKANISCPNIFNALDNHESSNSKFTMIEDILPEMILNVPKGDGYERNDGKIWYNSNKEIKLTVSDIDSGINNIDVFVNNENVLADKNGIALLKKDVSEKAQNRNNDVHNYVFDTDYFTQKYIQSQEDKLEPKDGKYLIEFKVTDNSGNIASTVLEYYLDKTSPRITSIDFSTQTADGIGTTNEFIEKHEYGYYFKVDFNISVNVIDENASSGLNEVQYCFVPYKDGEIQPEILGAEKIKDGKANIIVPKGFKGEIYVEALDNVSLTSGKQKTKAYVKDSIKPDISIIKNVSTNYLDNNGNGLYTQTNSFTVVVKDSISGIKQIGYLQNSEKNSYDRKVLNINNKEYKLEDDLGDGWIVKGTDINLVTQIEKTFVFSQDDNDIVLTFDATDNSLNQIEDINSEMFTIDKTKPVINVSFSEDNDDDLYYNQNRIAEITIIERNFDEALIDVLINNTFGDIPNYSFNSNSNIEHKAVINFDDGDYKFDVAGKDLGDNVAIVSFNGGNEKQFYVDTLSPVVEENFTEFTNLSENSFNVDKFANITITEHNFDEKLCNVKIFKKGSGEQHNMSNLNDVTSDYLKQNQWKSQGDTHTISFKFFEDAVYYVKISPVDLAGNVGTVHSTVVFEIDKTAPVVSMKNETIVGEYDTELLDIYSLSRKEESVPTVEFKDYNISHINWKLTKYIPDYSKSDDLVIVEPVVTNGSLSGSKYTVQDFSQDGVYAVELVAVDIAGNESRVNLNTYVRLFNQDVLAFIMGSNIENKTGLYSFEYESGEPISKKPSSFEDLKIFTMTPKNTPIDIVLRDKNGNEIKINAQRTSTDESLYGVGVYNYILKSDFFKENFQNDTDVELNLTVKNQGLRIDLGTIHIDSIEPLCDIPLELKSWKWMYGKEERKFVITNVSELLDENNCKIYDNGNEIPFVYSSDNNEITFTLKSGWHNVGISVADMAGNVKNIQEITNLHIGYFWLWIIIPSILLVVLAIFLTIFYHRKKKQRELEEI